MRAAQDFKKGATRSKLPEVSTEAIESRAARRALIASAALTAALYALPSPWDLWLGYPFILLSTLAHELGHGVAAELVGGEFVRFVMSPDAAGMATTQIPTSYSALGRGAVSAGGLIGPSVVSGACFVAARTKLGARLLLGVMGVALLLALVLVVRNLFAAVVVIAFAASALALSLRTRPEIARVALLFVAVQLALSVFSRSDYLFTEVAHTARGDHPSDVAQMADALLLPHWFWGALCGTISLLVLSTGLYFFFRAPRAPSSLDAAHEMRG